MFEILFALFLLCFWVGLLALVGHGIWLILAWFFKALAGAKESQQAISRPIVRTPTRQPSELEKLAITEGQLRDLLDRQELDRELFDKVHERILARQAALRDQLASVAELERADERRFEAMPAAPVLFRKQIHPTPSARQTPAPQPEPVSAPAQEAAIAPPQAPTPLPVPVPPPSPPLPPRRSFAEMLAAFMEDRNIVWGELIGGLLMVGCSIALVISLWQSLEKIPYFPFLVFAAITAALYGAGSYTHHHWKLQSTSRGLLFISILLVPLDLIVLSGLAKGREGGFLEIGTEAASLVGFGFLLSRAVRILIPDARASLTATLLGISASQLLTPWLLSRHEPTLAPLLGLGLWPMACFGLGVGRLLYRTYRRRPLHWQDARALFAFLGVTTYALTAAIGFLVYWCGDIGLTLERLSTPIALAGLPLLATGVLLWRNLAEEDDLASTRTAGTAIALVGLLIQVGAVALAWPMPGAVLLICAINFVVLTPIAFAFELPAAHPVALACLIVGYLTGFHLLAGHLDVGRAELESTMLHWAGSSQSGSALVIVAVLLATVAEALLRWGRRTDGLVYAYSGGVAALVSLGLVNLHGLDQPAWAAVVSGFYGAVCLGLSFHWRRAFLPYAGLSLMVVATLWQLHSSVPGEHGKWGLILAIEGLTLSLVSLMALLRNAARSVGLTTTALAVALVFSTPIVPAVAWHPLVAALAGMAMLLFAWGSHASGLTWVGSILLAVACVLGLHSYGLGLPWRRMILAGLLGHATISLIASRLLASRAILCDVVAKPLGLSAIASSVLAAPFVLSGPYRETYALSLHAAWLAALWLPMAWLHSSRKLFAAFQMMATLAVLHGVTAWLAARDWFHQSPPVLFGTRSLHAYGIGLALLGIGWEMARLVLFRRAGGPESDESPEPASTDMFSQFATGLRALWRRDWGAVDRIVLVALVVGQFLFALGSLWRYLGPELNPAFGFAEADVVLLAFNAGAWWVLGLLALALFLALQEEGRPEPLVGLWLLSETAPILIAGRFVAERAAVPALLWSLAFTFFVCSSLLWLRIPLTRILRIDADTARRQQTKGTLQALLLLGMLAPVLYVSASVLLRSIGRLALRDPLPASFFAEVGWLTSYLVPLIVSVLALIGHAVRERSAGFAFTAGLVVNLTAAFVVSNSHREYPLQQWWVFLAQVQACVSSVVALIWLSLRKRFVGGPWLSIQSGLGLGGCTFLLGVALTLILGQRSGPMPELVLQAGRFAGWLALGLGAAAAVWRVRGERPKHGIHLYGILCVLCGILFASFAARWDEGDWLTIHTLTTVWGLLAAALLTAGWSGAASDLLPAAATRRWVFGLSGALVFLALRGMAADPDRPYPSASASLLASALIGAVAIWGASPRLVYPSGLLFNVAGLACWWAWTPNRSTDIQDLLYVQIICLAASALVWTLLLLTSGRGLRGIDPNGRTPFVPAALAVGMTLLTYLILGGIAFDAGARTFPADGQLAWAALLSTACALIVRCWDPASRLAGLGLYVLGLLAIALGLHERHLPPRDLAWWASILLALHAVAMNGLAWLAQRHPLWRNVFLMPEPIRPLFDAWFQPIQLPSLVLIVDLSLWTSLDFAVLPDRLGGPAAVLLLLGAAIVQSFLVFDFPHVKALVARNAALALGVLFLTELAWAILPITHAALALHRAVLLLMALVLMTLLYGFGLRRWLDKAWSECCRRMAPVLGVLACGVLLVVLGYEFVLFNPAPEIRRTPLAWWGILFVSLDLVALIAAAVLFAVAPGRDPLGLTERGRTLYVYLAEALLALLILHLRPNVPEIFPRISGRYWPLVVMFVAYIGAGLSVFFQRRGLNTLAQPLQNTGVFLPLLPLIAFWIRPTAAMHDLASQRLPGLRPLVDYLDRLPQNFGDHAGVWLLLGLLYAGVAVSAQSFRFALAAALAGNFGLWSLLYHQCLEFLVHPQLWLIPFALILLVAEQLNQARLKHEQRLALRYLALTLIYVSSTADMFIAGLGNSVVLPLALAVLSILGVLTGILLRVRAFMVMGFAFLFLVIFSMIWHAAVDRSQTWIWWASGIVLGAFILVLFGIFEKRRNDVLRVVEELKQWR